MKTIGLRQRRTIYWLLLPAFCLLALALFGLARSEGATNLSGGIGVPVVVVAATAWWIFVPSTVIGRCPRCREWFFASIRGGVAWPAGNPFRSACWRCGLSIRSADTA